MSTKVTQLVVVFKMFFSFVRLRRRRIDRLTMAFNQETIKQYMFYLVELEAWHFSRPINSKLIVINHCSIFFVRIASHLIQKYWYNYQNSSIISKSKKCKGKKPEKQLCFVSFVSHFLGVVLRAGESCNVNHMTAFAVICCCAYLMYPPP